MSEAQRRLSHRLSIIWFSDLVGRPSLKALGSRIDRLGAGALFDMARACAQLGRPDEAFDLLRRVVAERNPNAPQLVWEPALAPLRSDPRFHDLKRELGLGDAGPGR